MKKKLIFKSSFLIVSLLFGMVLDARIGGSQNTSILSAAQKPNTPVAKLPPMKSQIKPALQPAVSNDISSLYDWFISLTDWDDVDDAYLNYYQVYFTPVQHNQLLQKRSASIKKQPQNVVAQPVQPAVAIATTPSPPPIINPVVPAGAINPSIAVVKKQIKPSRYTKLQAAGVLPIVYDEDHNKREVILGREIFKKGGYGYFGGEAELKDKDNAFPTAIREFKEEAILGQIFGWNDVVIGSYIKNNIKGCIITATEDETVTAPNRYTYAVTYIVDMGAQNAATFFEKFKQEHDALMMQYQNNNKLMPYVEMDKIISVSWDDFENYLKNFTKVKLVPRRVSHNDNDFNGIRIVNGLILKTMFDNSNKVNIPDSRFPLGVYVYFSKKNKATGKYAVMSAADWAQQGLDVEDEKLALYYKIRSQLFGD